MSARQLNDIPNVSSNIIIPRRFSTNGVKRTDSAILAYLNSNHSCIPGDNDHAIDSFRVLANGRS